jgi:hypothetical protein
MNINFFTVIASSNMDDKAAPIPKTQGGKMLKQAYGFMKELQLSANSIEKELARSILRHDFDAVRSCWKPTMVHYRQEVGIMWMCVSVPSKGSLGKRPLEPKDLSHLDLSSKSRYN